MTTTRTGLMDPNFRYVKAAETNIAKTFARIKRQLKEQEAARAAAPAPNVRPIKKGGAA